MKTIFRALLGSLLIMLAIRPFGQAQQQYTEDQLQAKVKEATAAGRRLALDSLNKAVAQQQATAKTVQEAVTAALAANNVAKHSEDQIGTVSLVPAERYAVFTGNPATPVLNRYFRLEQMDFYLENGRLLRVYAVGKLEYDSLYRQRLPLPGANRLARQEAAAANKARADQNREQTAANDAQRQADRTTASADKLRLLREARQHTIDANQYRVLADGAEFRAKLAAADSSIQNLPAATPDGPRIVTRHKYVQQRSIRFTNGTVPIDLNQPATDPRNLDLLIADEYLTATPYSLRFLDLVSVVHSTGRQLLTDNESWTLKPGGAEATHRLLAGASLAGLLDVALYTDLLATLNNEDNSLVTTEVGSYLPLNQRPTKRNSSFVLFTAARPFVTLARLDSKFDTLRLNSNSRIDRPDLLQRSYLRFGLNLNVLTFDNRRHTTFSLNTSWTRTITRVAGYANKDTALIRNVYQNLYGLELQTTIRRQRNFGADLYFTAYLHNAQSRRHISNPGREYALRPGALFYYHPFGSPSNKLFFRVSNFIFPKGRQRDFVQLQVGYSIGIGNLLQGQTTAPATAGTPSTSTPLLSPQ